MPQWASRRLAGYGETELFLELARMVVESTGVRDLDAILQDAAAPAASQRTFLDPQAALEQSSSPLGPSATRHRRDDPGSRRRCLCSKRPWPVAGVAPSRRGDCVYKVDFAVDIDCVI